MNNNAPPHLLDIESLSKPYIEGLLDSAQIIRDRPENYCKSGAGQLLINLFYEPSTRTRVSFEIAAGRLGMQVVNVAASGSSVAKGESLLDTYRTLLAMGPDIIVLRHPDNGAHAPLAAITPPGVRLVNAGDGSRAHPTQALLDAFTLRQHFPDLEKITMLVAGDLHHSRVTRSGVAAMKKLGVGEIRLASPPGLAAGPRVSEGTTGFESLDAALPGVDAVMMLRVQRERLVGLDVPDNETYHRSWGLTAERLALAAPGCIVMHPGPMNRGAEIAPEVADGPQSVILEQVRNGVFVRMAVLQSGMT
jgi:aspartate carbamoyltransferase catalytic subunit